MKQILQNLKTGATEIVEIPVPNVRRGHLLIQTAYTLVSAGTERMLVDFGKAGWLDKARQQPEKVRMAIDKIKTDGLQPTIEAVVNKLDQPLALGYCNVGCVQEIGDGVAGFAVGQRVISNGKHAEVVSVPLNLCAKVPDSVTDEEASFTVLGAIALQGIRLVQPTLGETVVVTGLGLIGLMTVQLLRANGCRVVGIDFDPEKLALAHRHGAEVVDLSAGQDPVKIAEKYSRGRGVDAVIITATTKSSEPVHQAALMCRKRGRIVLVGVTGLELSRDDFFKKELTFQVSASYGPGRYDHNYEENGQDYPVGFVRWTEQRNFEAVLDMMADGRLDVKPLISHRFNIKDARAAYELIADTAPTLGVLLEYPGIDITRDSRSIKLKSNFGETISNAVISFIGAGNYATSVLIPAFKDAGAKLHSVASSSGVTGQYAGKKFGFEETTTDSDGIFSEAKTHAVVITTRHDSHAQFVLQGIASGKHIFIEKPLCLSTEELDEIEVRYARADHKKMIMVGFNRRFAPQVIKVKALLKSVTAPKAFIMTVNAGSLSADHWTQDLKIGGGRIVGEACHFIDLLRFLAGSPIKCWSRSTMGSSTEDTVSLSLQFEDGSIGTVHYFANGCKSVSKERLEVFAQGGVLRLDNYRKLTGYEWPGFKKMNLRKQDKGQRACAKAFIDALEKQTENPIPIDEVFEVARVTIELARGQQ